MKFILAFFLAVAGLWLAYHFIRGFVAGFLRATRRSQRPSLKIVRQENERYDFSRNL